MKEQGQFDEGEREKDTCMDTLPICLLCHHIVSDGGRNGGHVAQTVVLHGGTQLIIKWSNGDKVVGCRTETGKYA